MASIFGDQLERLIQVFSKFPSLGPRSAQRILLYLLKHKETVLRPFIQSLVILLEKYRPCTICGYFSEDVKCHFCTSSMRDASMICVVAEMRDVWALEKANFFQGQYHLLGGLLSSFDQDTPLDLNIQNLLQRLNENVKEVILALDSNLEGQTTTHFLTQHLKEKAPHIKISTLARGIPMGGELSYLDQGTLMSAFSGRKDIDPLEPLDLLS